MKRIPKEDCGNLVKSMPRRIEGVICDDCSLKASLSQGREGKMEGKGTPELTDYAYSRLMV
jgi:hypothetical protein